LIIIKKLNMNIFYIFKRKKPRVTLPKPEFENNWLDEKYQQNIKDGVAALQNGLPVHIFDDGRGYELALDIKRQFILEYQKQLAEKIKVESGPMIKVYFSKLKYS